MTKQYWSRGFNIWITADSAYYVIDWITIKFHYFSWFTREVEFYNNISKNSYFIFLSSTFHKKQDWFRQNIFIIVLIMSEYPVSAWCKLPCIFDWIIGLRLQFPIQKVFILICIPITPYISDISCTLLI